MAIVFNCPQCNLPYKLKDEFAGKRATCKNPECRKVIQIPSASSGLRISELGGIAPEDGGAGRDDTPMPTNPADVEAAALAALRDSVKEEEDTAAEKAIPVVCPHCDHKWMEPFERGGKNTLCPNEECRQRVKIPMPKKGDAPHDWRSGVSNKPTLAKENFEKPTDVMDAETKVVTKKAWEEGGGAEQDLEPVSLKRRLFIYSLIGTPILLIAIGVYVLVTWRGEVKEEQNFNKMFAEFEPTREELDPKESPLFSAILELAAGEYALYPKHAEKDKELAQALQHFTKSRSELQQAAQKDPQKTAAAERFAVTGELAMATLGLGGTDEQIKDGSRYRWTPDAPNGRPLRVNERVHTVHEELQKTLALVKETADFDTKAALARRLTRELAKKGQQGLATDFPVFLFSDAEMPEAKAIVALELYRTDRGSPEAKKVADELKSLLAAGAAGRNPIPASAQALWIVTATEKPPALVPPPSAVQLSEPSRLAYVAANILKDNPADALELARRSGTSLPGQLRAIALYAEWAPDPTAAFDAAISTVNLHTKSKSKEPPPGSILLRLSQLAASTGRMDHAKQLADLIPDEGQKAWAKGSAFQFSATPDNKTKVEDSALELPDDSKKLRAGHAWGRMWQARQNTRALGGSDANKGVTAWPKGTIRPFGMAGVSLGQHDK